jgi:endogenous inhibitor of DNA gyrase (YacG/DUF329 family)
MVSGMFSGLFGPKVCATCKKEIKGKAEKYGGKAFCSSRCMDIYRHKDLSKLEK